MSWWNGYFKSSELCLTKVRELKEMNILASSYTPVRIYASSFEEAVSKILENKLLNIEEIMLHPVQVWRIDEKKKVENE